MLSLTLELGHGFARWQQLHTVPTDVPTYQQQCEPYCLFYVYHRHILPAHHFLKLITTFDCQRLQRRGCDLRPLVKKLSFLPIGCVTLMNLKSWTIDTHPLHDYY